MLPPLIIAHRGASAVAPENTIAAFEAAITAGADGIEFDVRLSRDNLPVIIHDDTLYRTHGIRRRVADMTLNELIQVGVPSLAQLFDLFRSNELLLCLEMKCEPGQQATMAEACARSIDEYQLRNRIIVECFDLSALKILNEIDPALKTAALFQSPASPFMIDRAIGSGASVLALHYRCVNARMIQQARSAGLKIVVWTVDDPTWVERARSNDIEALITNDPAALLAARDTSV